METWLASLLDGATVYVPTIVDSQVHWQRYTAGAIVDGTELLRALGGIRAAEPVKSFLFSPRAVVAGMPKAPEPVAAHQVVFGMKNCDLVPLRVHERILGQGEYADPFYLARIAGTVKVVADCPKPEPSCFCNLLGNKPYSTEGADAVVTALVDRLLIETLTEVGERLVKVAPGLFRPATEAELEQRAEQRRRAEQQLQQINPQPWNSDLSRAIEKRLLDAAFWERHAQHCVECYGCLFGCPTCYCFLLYDRASDSGFERIRVWDACYEAAYARVGGGANDRGKFLKRFANRFDCKWNQFKNDHGFYACSGCGRCFRACMGGIDIRKVLAEV